MNIFFQSLLTASFHGSIVILAVILLRLLLKKTPRKYICFLWMLAGIRLLMPIPVTSRFSLQPSKITIPVPIHPTVWLLLLWLSVALAIGMPPRWSSTPRRSCAKPAIRTRPTSSLNRFPKPEKTRTGVSRR